MTTASSTATGGTYPCDVAVKYEPTHAELNTPDDGVTVSLETVRFIDQARSRVDAPTINRQFGGSDLSADDKMRIVQYKVEVLKGAYEDAGCSYRVGCEIVRFALFRWELSASALTWLVVHLDRSQGGSSTMIRRWANRAALTRGVRRRS